jgi:carnitine-CoA ligase
MGVVATSRPVPATELWAFCEGRIPSFAIPRFIRFVDALPKTPSEKVRKSALRDDGVTTDTHDRLKEGRR